VCTDGVGDAPVDVDVDVDPDVVEWWLAVTVCVTVAVAVAVADADADAVAVAVADADAADPADAALEVIFDDPQRPVAPGQTVALYDALDPDAVVGAGIAA